MSSAASISAAKKRRANQVQPPMSAILQQPQMQMQRPMTAPSLATLTPAQRQQFMLQQQQRAQQARSQVQPQPQPQPQSQSQSQSQQARSQSQSQQARSQSQQPQQPQQPQSQGKRSELTWPAPPIYLMKQMDTMLFQQSQSIDDIKNRLNCIESGSFSESGLSGLSELPVLPVSELDLEQIKPALMSDPDFVGGIVDNIMTNSNLSEIIEQIDTVQAENRELRELLHAQQKTINEMNVMLLKIISQSLNQQVTQLAIVPTSVDTGAEADAEADADAESDTETEADAETDADATDADPIRLEVIDTID
jgi:hypothetical protein